MNDLKVFEGKEVEIIDIDGVILFNPRHVAVCLDIAESTLREHLADMSELFVRKLTNSDVRSTDIRTLNNAGENFLTEAGLYKLIFKSRKPEAEKFQDWVTSEVLPSIRKTGSYTVMDKTITKFDMEFKALGYAMDILKASDVSRLECVGKLYDHHNISRIALPVYVGNAKVRFSATKLLEDRGKPISIHAFNQLMLAAGFLEEKTRHSTTKGIKKFKALTLTGLKFGENLISPQNNKEVQPHYYEDSFDELLTIIMKQGG